MKKYVWLRLFTWFWYCFPIKTLANVKWIERFTFQLHASQKRPLELALNARIKCLFQIKWIQRTFASILYISLICAIVVLIVYQMLDWFNIFAYILFYFCNHFIGDFNDIVKICWNIVVLHWKYQRFLEIIHFYWFGKNWKKNSEKVHRVATAQC